MDSPLIIALDFTDSEPAFALVQQVGEHCKRFKVGKTLFTRSGPAFVERLQKQGFEIFLDLKYHDIPNTVAQACQVAANLGVWMLNVHALGGREMLLAAREAVDKCQSRPLLIAVTLLTSLNDADLAEIGLQGSIAENVLRLAHLVKACGLDGLVCSPHEITLLRTVFADNLTLVTPGIRPLGTEKNDQKRLLTPQEAVAQGANYLVVGRPITAASDPVSAVLAILESIQKK